MYINGKMIINTKINEIIERYKENRQFIEYWLFVKNKNEKGY